MLPERTKMQAGEELDKMIAPYMGIVPCDAWEHANFGSAGGPVLMKRAECGHEQCYPTNGFQSMFGQVGGCPRYSTDIGMAWKVWSKIRAEHTGRWVWQFEGIKPGEVSIRHEGPTGIWTVEGEPALAICLATIQLLNLRKDIPYARH